MRAWLLASDDVKLLYMSMGILWYPCMPTALGGEPGTHGHSARPRTILLMMISCSFALLRPWRNSLRNRSHHNAPCYVPGTATPVGQAGGADAEVWGSTGSVGHGERTACRLAPGVALWC